MFYVNRKDDSYIVIGKSKYDLDNIYYNEKYRDCEEIGKIYESKECGKFKVVKYAYNHKRNGRFFVVEFLNTGERVISCISHINEGNIMDPSIEQSKLIGKRYKTNNDGWIKILKADRDIIKSDKSPLYFVVEFEDTGFIKSACIANILQGKVHDDSKNIDYIGMIFKSNHSSECKVIEKLTKQYYRVQYTDTKTYDEIKLANLLLGKFKNPMRPSVYNVGYPGYDKDLPDISKEEISALRSRWSGMLARCYSSKSDSYKSYGQKGVTVCDRWHCFTNYCNDVIKLPGYDKNELLKQDRLELDKDLLQQDKPVSQRVYSKDTCTWLSPEEHGSLRQARK